MAHGSKSIQGVPALVRPLSLRAKDFPDIVLEIRNRIQKLHRIKKSTAVKNQFFKTQFSKSFFR